MPGHLTIVPATRDDVVAFVGRHHRSHGRPTGYLFACAVADDNGAVVGVAVVGRPSARSLQDGWTCEITRTCTDGTRNANSALYGACWRAARALGYRRAVTYTEHGETGASLRAAGWRLAAELDARPGWDTPARRRGDGGHASWTDRYRWEVTAGPPPWPARPAVADVERPAQLEVIPS